MTAHNLHLAAPWYRRRTVTDTALALLVAVFTGTGEFGTNDFFGPTLAGLDSRFPPLWLGVPLTIGVGLLSRWRRRLPLVLLAASLLANAVVSAHMAVAVALFTLAERTGWPRVAAATLVSTVLVGIPIWRFAGADGSIPISTAVCIAPVLLGMYVGTRHELVERVREWTRRMERDQQQRIASARSDERAQIARDMHDVVTHRVSLMVLQATALEASIGGDPVAIGKQIGATGREALEELRSLVGILRNEGDAPLAPQRGLADLAALIEESRRIGIPVTLDVVNPAAQRPPLLVEHAAYRLVREALTNVHKHAPAAQTRVHVEQTPRLLRLSVRNARGRPVNTASLPAGGHGLLGLAERVRLVGGEFAAGPTPDGGFEVVAEVPIRRGEVP
ncbi:histidine kinase [Dactylosporangium sp. AC04546]|uniref:sensor histidine kinase n=1 Tax=Dactylosporangium sp. AC04546 TaxID=2862460 RepID=UPI001EDE5EE8|nr:histidine kinase [Dactylosporangium sp. AC04546]WVK80519.1 histidine kinase [Dactylosporangium sp. AC04546]